MNSLIVQKAHREAKHLISGKTLGVGLFLIAASVIALTVFRISLNTLLFAGILLLCPLMHIWMMKDGGHKH